MNRATRILAGLLTASALAGISTTSSLAAGRKTVYCGTAQPLIVVGASHVGCKTARAVARAYLRGNHHPHGFSCRRIPVNAAAGWYGRCTRGAALVTITPE